MASFNGPPGDSTKNWWASEGFRGEARPVVAAGLQNRAIPPSSRTPSPSPSAVINPDNHIRPEEDDNDGNDELTPPPDTPLEPTVGPPVYTPIQEPYEKARTPSKEPVGSPAKAVHQPASLSLVTKSEDEIVVGSNSNKKPAPEPTVSEPEDVEMAEAVLPGQYAPKRKRNTQQAGYQDDSRSESTPIREQPETRTRMGGRPKTHGMGASKGVLLGYWRDSPAENPEDKHAITGFIDVRDRLRTRLCGLTRDGRDITRQFPMPPGPGGSWVTFERIVFDPHLVMLDHNQVKEYVKIRAETLDPDETLEETAALDAAAVKEAIVRVKKNPPPETAQPVAIAYGPELPEHVSLLHRPDKRRRVTQETLYTDVQMGNGTPPAIQQPPLDPLDGTRPTQIVIGYWKNSSEADPADKHAVYGILGSNDMFRVKLARETRDGRPRQGNFPSGPGALWIPYEDVEFEPHLRHLGRAGIKEYCRVRQRQIDLGEVEQDRLANIERAVRDAEERATFIRAESATPAPNARGRRREDVGHGHPAPSPYGFPMPNGRDGPDFPPEHPANHGYLPPPQPAHVRDPGPHELPQSGPHGLRQSRRNDGRPRHNFPALELGVANRPPPRPHPDVERINALAARDAARLEANQNRVDQRREAAEMGGPPSMNQQFSFEDNRSRLNRVWAAQEAHRIKLTGEDAKIHAGVKYERKSNGPFEGKLVSQGNIITIDGEDYVEYRVLTKPSFF